MEIHLTIDFFDDLMRAEGEWTEPALRQLIRQAAEKGVSTIHWIGHGRFGDGMWDANSYFDRDGKAVALRQHVPHARSVVVDEAHRCGIQIWAVIKPFDLAFGLPYAYHTEETTNPVGLPQIGATGSAAIGWLRENPHYRMRIHPSLDALTSEIPRDIRTIRLWHQDETLTELPSPEVYVSDDNNEYKQLKGDIRFRVLNEPRSAPIYAPATHEYPRGETRQCAGLEITLPPITQPFVALHFGDKTGLRNTLTALAELTDETGEPLPFTYGFTPRQPYGQRDLDWRQHGISFDTARSTKLPRGQLPSLMRCELDVDDIPCLAFAKGRNRYLTAPLELSVPGASAAILGMIDDAIVDGVDGVDLRMSSHAEQLDVENYGFNPEAFTDYVTRYGVKPAGPEFDRATWQQFRAEALTRLMEAASKRLRSAGRGAAFHTGYIHDHNVDEPGYMGYWWPWREWVTAGLFDTITAKQCPVESDLSAEAVAIAHANCMKAWINRKPPTADREAGWIDLMERAKQAGFDAFNIYECANLIRLEKDGHLTFDYPRFWERVKQMACL